MWYLRSFVVLFLVTRLNLDCLNLLSWLVANIAEWKVSSRDDEMVVQEYFSYLGGNSTEDCKKNVFIAARRGAKRGSSTSQACGGNYLSSSRSQEYCWQDCQLCSQVNSTSVVLSFVGLFCLSPPSATVCVSPEAETGHSPTAFHGGF